MHLDQRVLVTGGAGFIGSYLCERAPAAGREVLCVDNFFTGSRANIKHLQLPQDDPRQRQPVIEQAQSVLGWQPKTVLKDGLVKTIAYFDKLLGDSAAGSATGRS